MISVNIVLYLFDPYMASFPFNDHVSAKLFNSLGPIGEFYEMKNIVRASQSLHSTYRVHCSKLHTVFLDKLSIR